MYKNYYCYILSLPLLIILILMLFICNSWISFWMIMEMNLILFIFLIMFDKQMKYENLMMYFLFQSLNSYVYLVLSLIQMTNLSIYNKNMFLIILEILMLMKMGFPPFMMWYLKLLNNMNWINIYILSTIQKIIPLYIFMMLINMNNIYSNWFILSVIILCMLYSSLVSMNQTNLKFIMGYSSVIQMSWILNLMFINEMVMFLYIFIYFLILLKMFLMFNFFNINNLLDLSIMKIKKFWIYLLLMTSIMSLSGLPPFSGFCMKWLSIQNLFSMNPFIYLYMMIITSLLSMFFYFRILYFSFMFNSVMMKYSWKLWNLDFSFSVSFTILSWWMFINFQLFLIFVCL